MAGWGRSWRVACVAGLTWQRLCASNARPSTFHARLCTCGSIHTRHTTSLTDHRESVRQPLSASLPALFARRCSSGGEKNDKIFTWPNVLSAGRLVSAPILAYLIHQQHYELAVYLFVAAGLTDAADGYIARNVPGQMSVLGSVLDPLADKVLVGALTLSLVSVNLIPWPLAVVVLGRDALLVCGAMVMRYRSLTPPRTLKKFWNVGHATLQIQPNTLGKFNTILQIVTLASSLGAPVFGYVDHQLLQLLWYTTGASTFLSGLTYAFSKDAVKVLKEP